MTYVWKLTMRSQVYRPFRDGTNRITTLTSGEFVLYKDFINIQSNYNGLATAKDLNAYFQITDTTLWRWYTFNDFPKPFYPHQARRWQWADIKQWEQQRITNPSQDKL